MEEDRIESEFSFSYSAKNSKGVKTLEILPTKVIVKDQSVHAASAHLVSVLQGIMAPSQKQVER